MKRLLMVAPAAAVLLTALAVVGCESNRPVDSAKSRAASTGTVVMDEPVASKEMMQYVSSSGITIPRGSPGAPAGIGTLYYPAGNQEQALPLDGDSDLGVLRYSGIIVSSATGDGKVAAGTRGFKPTRIQTFIHQTPRGCDQPNAPPCRWFKISSFLIDRDGFLVVTDETGDGYRITVGLGRGKLEQLKNAQYYREFGGGERTMPSTKK